jgi:SAM-dependent methyltransferase
MSESGTVRRGKHLAQYEVSQGKLRVSSEFGMLVAPLMGERAEVLAGKILGYQIGTAARQAGELGKDEAARHLQSEWEEKWVAAPRSRWVDRAPPAEMVDAVASGWLPSKGRVIDLGCGTAEIAAWFAERGYEAMGADIAQAAVDRAARKHAHLLDAIEFIAVDLCTQTIADRSFDILIDRGCLHQIPPALVADYVRNVASIAAPGAKMMLFSKAFRDGNPFGDAEETAQMTEWVRNVFAGEFELERALPTYLDPDDPKDPLPGMAFWLTRTG